MTKHPNPLIHKEPFSVPNPARFGALLVGVLALALGLITLNSAQPEISPWIPRSCLSGFAVFTLLFIFFPKRKRQLRIFPDHLEIFAKGKKIQSFQLSDTGRHRSDRKWMFLGPETGPTAIVIPKGEKGKVQGLVEILLMHREDLPPACWSAFKMSNEAGKHISIFPEHRRVFLEESREALFLDQGIRVSIADRNFYFPTTPTAPVVYPRPQGSISGYMQQGQYNPVPKFDPDPSRLPIQSILIALFETDTSSPELLSTLELLSESYSGSTLNQEQDSDLFTGNTLGYPVQVMPSV